MCISFYTKSQIFCTWQVRLGQKKTTILQKPYAKLYHENLTISSAQKYTRFSLDKHKFLSKNLHFATLRAIDHKFTIQVNIATGTTEPTVRAKLTAKIQLNWLYN